MSTEAGAPPNAAQPLLLQEETATQSEDASVEDAGTQEYTSEEAIEHIGFGRFQIMLLIVAGLSWMAVRRLCTSVCPMCFHFSCEFVHSLLFSWL